MKKLPDHLSRECIIAAIRAYDAGVAHQFKNARLYEIEFEGRRYPSKAIVGLAAVDYAGYGTQAEFYQFEYQELGDALAADGSYSWEAGETRDK